MCHVPYVKQFIQPIISEAFNACTIRLYDLDFFLFLYSISFMAGSSGSPEIVIFFLFCLLFHMCGITLNLT